MIGPFESLEGLLDELAQGPEQGFDAVNNAPQILRPPMDVALTRRAAFGLVTHEDVGLRVRDTSFREEGAHGMANHIGSAGNARDLRKTIEELAR